MLSHANLERQLLTAQTAKTELETKLREKDRWWFEKEEREEKGKSVKSTTK
jgi:hypothetical protein